MANTLWAVAKIDGAQQRRLSLPPALFDAVQWVAPQMIPQEVANTLWALSRLNVAPQQPLLVALLNAAESLAERMKPVEVLQLREAFSGLGIQGIIRQEYPRLYRL